MKKLLSLYSIAFLTLTANASTLDDLQKTLERGSYTGVNKEDVSSEKINADPIIKQSNCEAFSILAGSIYKARQKGISAANMYKTFDGDPEPVRKVASLLIKDVFRIPLVKSENYIEIAAAEYGNSYFISCMN